MWAYLFTWLLHVGKFASTNNEWSRRKDKRRNDLGRRSMDEWGTEERRVRCATTEPREPFMFQACRNT